MWALLSAVVAPTPARIVPTRTLTVVRGLLAGLPPLSGGPSSSPPPPVDHRRCAYERNGEDNPWKRPVKVGAPPSATRYEQGQTGNRDHGELAHYQVHAPTAYCHMAEAPRSPLTPYDGAPEPLPPPAKRFKQNLVP